MLEKYKASVAYLCWLIYKRLIVLSIIRYCKRIKEAD